MDLLDNPYNLIDDIASDEEKRCFGLDQLLVDIAVTLVNYRAKYGLTQKALAKKIGCSPKLIRELESAECNPSIKRLWEISSALGLEFKLIFKEKIEE